MYEGPGTSSLRGLYYPPLNNIADVEFDALYDYIEQDHFVPCDSREMKAWLQCSTDEVVPNLRDQL